MFSQNVGSIDRVLRIVLGLALIVGGFFFLTGTAGMVVGAIGLIPLLTGLIGWCPVYLPFKFNTHKS